MKLEWEVDGKAQLDATPSPPDWTNETPSKGERVVHPVVDTQFTLTSLEANPAKDGAPKHKSVQVKPFPAPRGPSADCDRAGHCIGKITIDAAPEVMVESLSAPRFVRSGRKLPDRELCVTPPTGPRQCFGGEASARFAVQAAGNWIFEANLLPGEGPTSPDELPIPMKIEPKFTFACTK